METHPATTRARLHLAAAVTASTACLVLLVRLGEASWARVDLRHPSAWLATTPAPDALPAVLRLVAMAGLGWVLTSLVVALVRVSVRRAGMLPAAGATRARDHRWIWPPARRLAERALGAALVVAAATPALAAAPPPPGLSPPGIAAPASAPQAAHPVPGFGQPPRTRLQAGPQHAAAAGRIVVEPGDNLWALAAAALGYAHDVDSDRLTPQAITPYWLDVLDANHQRLRSGDPDLIHPGEVIHLPPLPAITGDSPGRDAPEPTQHEQP